MTSKKDLRRQGSKFGNVLWCQLNAMLADQHQSFVSLEAWIKVKADSHLRSLHASFAMANRKQKAMRNPQEIESSPNTPFDHDSNRDILR